MNGMERKTKKNKLSVTKKLLTAPFLISMINTTMKNLITISVLNEREDDSLA